jgi:hypothetical protein
MSEDSATQLEEMYDKWDQRAVRRNFIARMEHKLNAKERNSDRSHR